MVKRFPSREGGRQALGWVLNRETDPLRRYATT